MAGYILVEDAERLAAVAEAIASAPAIALDTETTGLCPHTSRIRLVSVHTGTAVYVIDLFKTGTLGPVLDALRGPAIKVLQNAKFDQKFFLHHFGLVLDPVFDTYRASAIIYNGKNYKHDLYALYERELELAPPTQDLGGSNWAGSLTPEQYGYAASDVDFLLLLRTVFKPKLQKEKLNLCALLEFRAILPEASMELNGFYLNRNKWLQLYLANEEARRQQQRKLLNELPHPGKQLSLFEGGGGFNLGSTQMLQQSLALLGLHVDSTREMVLAMHAGEYPLVRDIIAYKKISKLCSSFGPDYMKHVNVVTGRVHAGYYPFTGAGRYACVASGTFVATSKGNIPIVKVRPGDLVLTHKGRFCRVRAWLPQGVRETWDVRLSTGEVLTCTPDHRVLLMNGRWATLQEIRDEQASPSPPALFAGEGQPGVEIEAIHVGRSLQVYDLSVENDESYQTQGIFSHNCSDPNLQQVPRTKAFRDCFEAEPGWKLVIADYSQVELRLAAEVSGDAMLMGVYQRGEDAHKQTASIVNEVPLSEVTKGMRQLAKPINFGLIYGLGADKLVQYAQASYGVSMRLEEAKRFIEKFFAGYKGIKAWHRRALDAGKKTGMTRTRSGRLRYLDETAHNQFLNTPIQGSGADGLKNALRLLYDRLGAYGGKAKLVHMVHDEIVLEVKDEDGLPERAKIDLEEAMKEGIAPFMPRVPAEVEGQVGSSWADK